MKTSCSAWGRATLKRVASWWSAIWRGWWRWRTASSRTRATPATSPRTSSPGSGAAPHPGKLALPGRVGPGVGAAIADLPERQRVALVLCHYQGLRNDEAAEIMDVTVEALESLLARARRTLGERLHAVAGELLEA